MRRLPSILILTAMAVIAGSAAVVFAIEFGFSAGQASLLGLWAFLAMALIRQNIDRRHDNLRFETRLAEIATVAGDGQGEIARLANRVARLEQALPARVREETETLSAEVEVVSQLLKQVAETLANLEQRVEERLAGTKAPPAPLPAVSPVRAAERPEPEETAAGLFVAPRPASPPGLVREVEQAIRGEAIEIHLQPIVTLPQRKVRYYEVLARLRSGDRLIEGAEFVPAAEERRLVPQLDTFVVIRSFQILKRLVQRNNDIGLFVNLSVDSLASSVFFRDFHAFLGQNRQMADFVQFEFRQDAIADMGPLEAESLKAIADRGFRLSLDNVTDLSVDFRALADMGFRTAKVAAERLLGRQPVTLGDIHLADVAGHLQRQGVMLVVDRVEQEAQVVDLLDFDVHFAQGHLFSAPRQVRPEVLGQSPASAPARREAVGGR